MKVRAAILALSCLSIPMGCSGVTPADTPAVSASHVGPALFTSGRYANIYVANHSNSTVTEYDGRNYALKRTISQGVYKPSTLALDSSGNLYVCNYNTVTVYAPGADQPSTTITNGISSPLTIAIDAMGQLYVGNWGANDVTVYAVGSEQLLRTISSGIDLARALAFSGDGDLFAANYNNSTVTVYHPGAIKPARTITQDINTPLALAFDASGNLYVANYQAGNVTVYAPGSDTPFRKLNNGMQGPDTLTFSPNGDLYVSNCDLRAYVGCWKPSPYGVTVFSPKSDEPKFQILNGVDEPTAVIIQPSGKVIVANAAHATVSVFAAHGNSLLHEITKGVHHAFSAALGP